MSIKSKSQQRFPNDNYRKGYEGIRWNKRGIPYPVGLSDKECHQMRVDAMGEPYGGRPCMQGVQVIGVVARER